MLKLDVGTDPDLPNIHANTTKQSLFQCLYSQCDSNDYGKALSRTISTCMDVGAEIYMVAPGFINEELLRVREADYLAGRQLPEIPGLQLRAESVPVTTVTTTFTDHLTMTITWSPTPTPFLTSSPQSTSINRPWVITQSNSTRFQTSFSGLVLWISIVLLQDYWINGY
ncbi:hypothetical protein FHL15_010146 [Xylaria flabelliformis]|uniref:Uncharacterized protein n=1 Tax=Xylaria flabelliformis TaxID=2512241 RepID=A0A553HLT2_9PEZI|nr:hypothetical protein FHL15_010146 [Xylaria flabelliformis]